MRFKVDKFPQTWWSLPQLLKVVTVDKVDALVVIFQNSTDSGIVPADWKVQM